FARWTGGLYLTFGHLCLGAYNHKGNWQVSLAWLDPQPRQEA
ncbi:hypothetical protein PMI01_04761, partial [Caulobacter sp. AP07]